jgi:hypothetical protein
VCAVAALAAGVIAAAITHAHSNGASLSNNQHSSGGDRASTVGSGETTTTVNYAPAGSSHSYADGYDSNEKLCREQGWGSCKAKAASVSLSTAEGWCPQLEGAPGIYGGRPPGDDATQWLAGCNASLGITGTPSSPDTKRSTNGSTDTTGTTPSSAPGGAPFVHPQAGNWIAVMASVPQGQGLPAAQQQLSNIVASVPDAQLLNSDEYTSLRPGYYVVFEGAYSSRDAAVVECNAVGRSVPDECYPRYLS